MKSVIVSLSLLLGGVAMAHDEGHGPKLTDAAKYGGKVAPVIAHKDISLGIKAPLLYKAEFTKNASNVVRIYLYDQKLQPKKDFVIKGVSGKIYFEDAKTKKGKNVEVTLAVANGEVTGTLPKDIGKPFDLDVTIETASEKLFIAFDGNR